MILVDANLLLYAYDASSQHHDAARHWLESTLSGSEPVGFAWVTLLAFLRIGTDHRAFASPLAPEEAVASVSEWLARPNVILLEAGDRHWEILSQMLIEAQIRGPLTMDAHLASLAIEHGATLCTTDRDFARFPGLKTSNPLQGS